MTESNEKSGFTYHSDQGEDRAMEGGSAVLGTPAAGAGPAADSGAEAPMPAGSGHHESMGGSAADFTYRSAGGEMTDMEEGTKLTEEGEAAARDGS